MKPKNAVRFDRTLGRLFYKVHRWIYEATDGRIGANSPQGPMLLLSTIGRRSRQLRTTPLMYMRDGDDFVVVGSNGGRPQPPAWFLNLQADPKATVRVGRCKLGVVADIAGSDETAELWPCLREF